MTQVIDATSLLLEAGLNHFVDSTVDSGEELLASEPDGKFDYIEWPLLDLASPEFRGGDSGLSRYLDGVYQSAVIIRIAIAQCIRIYLVKNLVLCRKST